jgi:hypothetical protein
MEVSDPNLTRACFRWHSFPTSKLVSNGDTIDCAVDEINQVAAVLGTLELYASFWSRRSRSLEEPPCATQLLLQTTT